tara:strand:- start:6009 stop:6359 length:351 start_codon:yes stop_codon:yes gene_type:complete
MDPSTLSSILDMGGIASLAAFLIWLNTKTQRRLDEMFESYQQSIKDQETAHTRAEELIRNRYDSIIARHEAQRQAVYDDMVKKLDSQGRAMEEILIIVRSTSSRNTDPTLTIPDFR